jgi:hypothetical protein
MSKVVRWNEHDYRKVAADLLDRSRNIYYNSSLRYVHREIILAGLLVAAGYPHEAASHLDFEVGRALKAINDDYLDISYVNYKTILPAQHALFDINRHIRNTDFLLLSQRDILETNRKWIRSVLGLDIGQVSKFYKTCSLQLEKIRLHHKIKHDLVYAMSYYELLHLNFIGALIRSWDSRLDNADLGPLSRETYIEGRLGEMSKILTQHSDELIACIGFGRHPSRAGGSPDRNVENMKERLLFFTKFHLGTLLIRRGDIMMSDRALTEAVGGGSIIADAHRGEAMRHLCEGVRAYRDAIRVYQRLRHEWGTEPFFKADEYEKWHGDINFVLKQVARQRLTCDNIF